MALVRIAPGIHDRDDRLADPLLVRIAHLQHPRAVPEGAEVVRCEPARAAQLLGGLACHLLTWFVGELQAVPGGVAPACGLNIHSCAGSLRKTQSRFGPAITFR